MNRLMVNELIGILGITVIIFFIAVLLIRWIFGIRKIIDLLTVIAQELRASNAVENVDERLTGLGYRKITWQTTQSLETKGVHLWVSRLRTRPNRVVSRRPASWRWVEVQESSSGRSHSPPRPKGTARERGLSHLMTRLITDVRCVSSGFKNRTCIECKRIVAGPSSESSRLT